MVAVGEQSRCRPGEFADEAAGGDEDAAGHVTRLVAGQIGVGGRHIVRWGGVQGALHAHVVEEPAPVELGDVRFELRAGRQPRLRPGTHHIGPHAGLLQFGRNG